MQQFISFFARRTALVLVLAALVATGCAHQHSPRALDAYIAKPESVYNYKLVRSTPVPGGTAYVIEMTSQQWRTPEEVDKPVWKHWLLVVKPDVVKHDTALLFIGGGSNKSKAPEKLDDDIAGIAMATNSVVVELRMIPNQPLIFANDGRERSEDEIISYGWDKYLRGGDEEWIVRFAMTKGAVKAMDTVQSFLATKDGGEVNIDKFVVAGGSKRGLTTWTTGAVDGRVVAIVPFVIDLLNTGKSFEHHYKVYGFWAPAINDYVELRLMDWFGTSRHHKLMGFEDPYQYRDRYENKPKYIVNAAGDQFFIPDSWQFYYHDLPGEKHLRYVPNADHGLGGTDAGQGLMAFYASVLSGSQRPRYCWDVAKDGSIWLDSLDKPIAVNVWQATNPNARDFRLETIGKAWTSTPLAPNADGLYVAKVDKPAKGFTAFFIEMKYDSGFGVPYTFTTGVKVLPDVYPHAAYKPDRSIIHNPPAAAGK